MPNYKPELIEHLAKKFGTPYYVYDRSLILSQLEAVKHAFRNVDTSIHYSVKANSNLSVLNLIHRNGGKFDAVSGGEISRCLKVGATGRDLVFAGVGKTIHEIDVALAADILQFNVESYAELERIKARAKELGKQASVALRINPDVDGLTHPHITTGTYGSKFGIPIHEAGEILNQERHSPHLLWSGLDMHIGSQLTEEAPIVKSLNIFTTFVNDMRRQGIGLRNLDIGGGLGISYQGEKVLSVHRFSSLVEAAFAGFERGSFQVIVEPGRFLVGESGWLITTVQYVKRGIDGKTFCIVDAGMTELIRPALYDSFHEIGRVRPVGAAEVLQPTEVVGPICESTDCFGRDRMLPVLNAGDILAIHHCGAYGASMAQNYNSRGICPEILVDSMNEGFEPQLIRRRESIEDLLSLEEKIAI